MLFRRCTYFSHLPLLLSFHCLSGALKRSKSQDWWSKSGGQSRFHTLPAPSAPMTSTEELHCSKICLQGWEMATTTGLEQGCACEEGSRNFIQKTPLFSILLMSFYCGKMCTTWHWPFSPHLSVQVSGRTHMHTVVQPSPSCISGAFHHLKQKLHRHWTTTPIHSSLQPWSPLFSFLSLWMWLL